MQYLYPLGGPVLLETQVPYDLAIAIGDKCNIIIFFLPKVIRSIICFVIYLFRNISKRQAMKSNKHKEYLIPIIPYTLYLIPNASVQGNRGGPVISIPWQHLRRL